MHQKQITEFSSGEMVPVGNWVAIATEWYGLKCLFTVSTERDKYGGGDRGKSHCAIDDAWFSREKSPPSLCDGERPVAWTTEAPDKPHCRHCLGPATCKAYPLRPSRIR